MSEEAISLSDREQEILKLVATGATNQQIAGDLGISVNTVKVHLRNIFGKIGANSRTEATLYAMRRGLVDVGATNGSAPPALTQESRPVVSEPQPVPTSVPAPARPGWLQRYGLLVATSIGGMLIALVILLLLGMRLGDGNPTPTVSPTSGLQVGMTSANWVALRDLPESLTGAAAATSDGVVYLIGGQSPNEVTGRVWRFDPTRNSLAALPEKPLAVSHIGAVVLGGKIWIPGGTQADGAVSRQLDVYDPANQSWETKAPLPQPRTGYGLAAVDGRMYLFGGWDGSQARAETLMYDPATDSWSELQAMPTARAYGA
ncbi:MAG TPA: LuxR C-terminal-related transcriptional regulator, partial [Roseiflexaceae bacterium]|nr:LuxR C-terminal-related transcriptional regulator [Roseiflexaceae bacterium]